MYPVKTVSSNELERYVSLLEDYHYQGMTEYNLLSDSTGYHGAGWSDTSYIYTRDSDYIIVGPRSYDKDKILLTADQKARLLELFDTKPLSLKDRGKFLSNVVEDTIKYILKARVEGVKSEGEVLDQVCSILANADDTIHGRVKPDPVDSVRNEILSDCRRDFSLPYNRGLK